MKKTIKTIAILSILFFLGSCTENYYNTTNNTYNTYNTVTGDSLSTQESLDSALFGVWRGDTTSGIIRRIMFGSDGTATIWKEYTSTGQFYEPRNGNWYTVGEILNVYDDYYGYNSLAEYSVLGKNLIINNSTYNTASSSWALPNGTYSKQ